MFPQIRLTDFDLENAVLGGRTPVAGQVSYRVEWTAGGATVKHDFVCINRNLVAAVHPAR